MTIAKDLFGLVPKNKTKPEFTSKRDIELSKRHRKYGLHINQEDIDFLEYDSPRDLIALIEYKIALDLAIARPPAAGEPNYANLCALEELANRASLPVFLTFYRPPKYQWWRVFPINRFAENTKPPTNIISEFIYVEFLHWLRKRAIPPEVKVQLEGGGF